MKILIIEDQILVARFIQYQLQLTYPDYCIEIAISVDEADKYMAAMRPNLVLCDIQLGDRIDGIDLMKKYRQDFIFSLIFITSFQSKEVIDRAAAVYPENYIIKPMDESRLYAGTHLLIQRISQQRQGNRLKSAYLDRLSIAEKKIIQLIAQNYTTKEIAGTLFLSPHTVKNTRHRICRKLELDEENNALLAWAIKNKDLLDL